MQNSDGIRTRSRIASRWSGTHTLSRGRIREDHIRLPQVTFVRPSHLLEVRGSIIAKTLSILIEIFQGFIQSSKTNIGIVFRNRPSLSFCSCQVPVQSRSHSTLHYTASLNSINSWYDIKAELSQKVSFNILVGGEREARPRCVMQSWILSVLMTRS